MIVGVTTSQNWNKKHITLEWACFLNIISNGGKKNICWFGGCPNFSVWSKEKTIEKKFWGLKVGGIHSNTKNRFVGDFFSALILFLRLFFQLHS